MFIPHQKTLVNSFFRRFYPPNPLQGFLFVLILLQTERGILR